MSWNLKMIDRRIKVLMIEFRMTFRCQNCPRRASSVSIACPAGKSIKSLHQKPIFFDGKSPWIESNYELIDESINKVTQLPARHLRMEKSFMDMNKTQARTCVNLFYEIRDWKQELLYMNVCNYQVRSAFREKEKEKASINRSMKIVLLQQPTHESCESC